MTGSMFGRGTGLIALDKIECDPSIHCTLLQCSHCPPYGGGSHSEDAVGVRCEQEKAVKSVSAANFTVTTPNYSTMHTVLINVTLSHNNITNLFQVGCYNQQHEVTVLCKYFSE